MGNLQSEPKATKSKIKGAKAKGAAKKKGRAEENLSSVVPTEQPPTPEFLEKIETIPTYEAINEITAPESSSESYLREPQSPVRNGKSSSIRETTSQDNFLHNLTLNSFKLNEYRARHEQEKSKKLSKLGVSKTSQISLETDPNECFVSDNVQIISQIHDDSGFVDSSLETEETVKKRPQQLHHDQNEAPDNPHKMSDVTLIYG